MGTKWICNESPDLPAVEVARLVLQLRLQLVEEMLPLAAHQYRRDVEHVHRLRVGCRRAAAAHAAFRPLMAHGSKRLRKWLKRIRRAAGPARDADVLLARIKEEPSGGPNVGYVIARLQRHRERAQQRLREVEAKARSGRLIRSVDRCLAGLDSGSSAAPGVTIGDFARRALRSVSRSMFIRAGVQDASVAQLHQLRIAGKRVRYSIELFHDVLPTTIKAEVYPLVEKIQTRLGHMNDHATAQAFFQRWLVNMPADERAAYLARRIADERAALDQSREDFLRWWTTKRAAELEAYLADLVADDG